MAVAHTFAPRKISQSVYVRGIRDDLDRRVDEIRTLQIALGLRKMCPACLQVLPVQQFARYQSRCCRTCERAPDFGPDRYEPVSFMP